MLINNTYSYRKITAFGLLEVMISAMILSISLLGVASLQSRVMNVSIEASRKETAYRMLRQLINFSVTADPAFLINFISTPATPAVTNICYSNPPAMSPGCTPDVFYQTMVREWKDIVAQILPSGLGCSCVVNNNSTAMPASVAVRFAIKWTALSGVTSTAFMDNNIVASLNPAATYDSCPVGTADPTNPTTICTNFN